MNDSLLKVNEDGTYDLSYDKDQIKKFSTDADAMLAHRQELEKDISSRCKLKQFLLIFFYTLP